MQKQKSEARLQWEAEYREKRRQATWERVDEFLARNPMGLSARAMTPSSADSTSQSLSALIERKKGDVS
jgi:hypothetical protein